LQDAFPHGLTVSSSSRPQDRAWLGVLLWLRWLRQGWDRWQLIWWMSKTGVNLWYRFCTKVATIVSLVSSFEPLSLSLDAGSAELYNCFYRHRTQIAHHGTWPTWLIWIFSKWFTWR
jgi:hypothetical protein